MLIRTRMRRPSVFYSDRKMHQPERARSHSELDRSSSLPTPGQDSRSGSSSVLLDRQLEAEAAVREHLPVRGRRGHLRARHGRNGQGKLHWVRRRHCVISGFSDIFVRSFICQSFSEMYFLYRN